MAQRTRKNPDLQWRDADGVWHGLDLGPAISGGSDDGPRQRRTAFRHRICECADSHCPVHPGQSVCLTRATRTLYRSDMVDQTGTRFCGECADDAMTSGLFREGA